MGFIRKTLFRLALLGGGLYGLYRFGLSDEAKEQLKGAINAVSSAASNIKGIIDEQTGEIVEDTHLPNKEQTMRDWERIGY